jgi:hypothetical protein
MNPMVEILDQLKKLTERVESVVSESKAPGFVTAQERVPAAKVSRPKRERVHELRQKIRRRK